MKVVFERNDFLVGINVKAKLKEATSHKFRLITRFQRHSFKRRARAIESDMSLRVKLLLVAGLQQYDAYGVKSPLL